MIAARCAGTDIVRVTPGEVGVRPSPRCDYKANNTKLPMPSRKVNTSARCGVDSLSGFRDNVAPSPRLDSPAAPCYRPPAAEAGLLSRRALALCHLVNHGVHTVR